MVLAKPGYILWIVLHWGYFIAFYSALYRVRVGVLYGTLDRVRVGLVCDTFG